MFDLCVVVGGVFMFGFGGIKFVFVVLGVEY